MLAEDRVQMDMDYRTRMTIERKFGRVMTDPELEKCPDGEMTDEHKRMFFEINAKCGGTVACGYISMIVGHARHTSKLYYTLLDMY